MEYELIEVNDELPAEPEREDYCYGPSGVLGGVTQVWEYGGKHLGMFREEEDALQFIRDEMERTQYFPNVWFISDHGNAHLASPI